MSISALFQPWPPLQAVGPDCSCDELSRLSGYAQQLNAGRLARQSEIAFIHSLLKIQATLLNLV